MKTIDRFVRARKAVKAARATEQGIAGHQAAMKALGKGVETPVDFVAGRGNVSVPSGDGWAGIEGVSNMEYKVVPGNPGPHTLKRPRQGNK